MLRMIDHDISVQRMSSHDEANRLDFVYGTIRRLVRGQWSTGDILTQMSAVWCDKHAVDFVYLR